MVIWSCASHWLAPVAYVNGRLICARFYVYLAEIMQCHCGTVSCRGTISGRDWQRPELQRAYGDYFSSYLLRRISHVP